VDETLLPIIRKVGQRGKAQQANKQGTLNGFFDVSVGTGAYEPRKRQAYESKRLQKVVSEFRKEQMRIEEVRRSLAPEAEEEEERPKRKRKAKAPATGEKGAKRKATGKKEMSVASSPTSSVAGPSVDTSAAIRPADEGLSAATKPRPRPRKVRKGGDDEYVPGRG
jgi:DNA excision repair protein ERCC-5